MKLNVTNEKALQELTKHLTKGVNIFVLIYMNGCGPCNATKPEWAKINNKWRNTIVSQIDKDVLENKSNEDKFHLKDVAGFPTIRHYNRKGKKDYSGERNVNAFEKWINSIVRDSKTKNKSRKRRGSKFRMNRTKRYI